MHPPSLRRTSEHRRPRRTRRPVRLVLRAPIVYWATGAALALLTFTTLRSASDELDRRTAALGATTDAVVALHDLPAGHRITPSDVELRSLPDAVVPETAVHESPVDARVRVPVVAGEVIVASRLASASTSRLAAAVPEGWSALAVPLQTGAIDLTPGDRVDLLAPTGDTTTGDSTMATVAGDALVVASGDTAVTVAVRADDVDEVAAAVLAATVTVVLVGPP